MTEAEFYRALTNATQTVYLDKLAKRQDGWLVCEAMERESLPHPEVQNALRADAELKNNPIFEAINQASNTPDSSLNLPVVMLAVQALAKAGLMEKCEAVLP